MEQQGSRNHPSGSGLDLVAVICFMAAALIGIAVAVAVGAAGTLPLILAVAGAIGGIVIAAYYLVVHAEWRGEGSWVMLVVYPLLGTLILYILGLSIWFVIEGVWK